MFPGCLKIVIDVSGDAEDALNGPQNKHLRIENKNFYFDIKKNQQGRYMSISEVKGNYRNSILVPESGWESFRDVLDEYVSQVSLTTGCPITSYFEAPC